MPFTVFPLRAIVQGANGPSCDCSDPGCKRVGKHPAVRWGSLEPGQQIQGPNGHGLVTGAKSGVFFVDTDGAEADERFRAMGPLPDTFRVKTPSDGRHYGFTWPGFSVRCSQGELGKQPGEKSSHIDIRGDGGFVVLPGSPHKSGRTYEIERNVPIAPAPAWLLEWPGLRGVSVSLDGDGESVMPVFPVDLGTDKGRERLEMGKKACAEFAPSIGGENGSLALWRLSLELVRRLEIPIETCFELVMEIYNPRCSPPWSPNEITHKLVQARDRSDLVPGNVTPINTDALGAPTKMAKPERKKPAAGHVYECSLGDVGNIAPSKISIGKTLDVLTNHPSWAGVLQYDAFRDRVVAVDPPIELDAEDQTRGFAENDVTSVRKWFETVGGYILSKETAWDAVIGVARRNVFHPVREYLESLAPEPPQTLDLAAKVFFGSDDPLDAVLVKKFMIGAARRILRPGEKVDTMLVLVGAQGAGKSTFVPTLFGEDFSSEDLADIRTKDAMIGLRGKWAIEVAELDKLLRSDPETVKAFVSRCVDPYRAPYERVTSDHPRQCVYVGTTNKDDFLRDPTGERRYWIVDVRGTGGIHLADVAAWRDRMWSAAFRLALKPKKDVPHWLTEPEAKALAARAACFKGENGWSEIVRTHCVGRDFVTVEEIWTRAIGGDKDKLGDARTVNKITDILRELGCEKSVRGKTRTRGWETPPSLRDADVPDLEKARREGEAMVTNIMNGSQQHA